MRENIAPGSCRPFACSAKFVLDFDNGRQSSMAIVDRQIRVVRHFWSCYDGRVCVVLD